MQKKGWLALCPTNYTFNILYCSFFPHQLVHSLSYIFFSSIFSSTHVQSHSSISTLLSFKFPLIFVILCCLPLSSTFFLCVRLLQLTSASSHLTFLHFSLKFLTVAFLFCFLFSFFFLSHICLFHLFLLLYIYIFFLVEILVLQSKLHAS